MAKRKRAVRDLGKAVGYIRVSTKEQHLGPDAQRKAIESWSAQHGVQIVAWYTDKGLSGSKGHEDRPGLVEAISALREHAAGVLVATRRDRFARDVGVVRDLGKALAAEGSRLVSVAGEGTSLDEQLDLDDPDACLSSGINDVLAEHYRLLIKRRTKLALAIKKANGQRTGGVTYGYHLAADRKTLEVDPAEQAVIQRIQAMAASGASIRKIVAQLNEECVPARGACWYVTSVARLINVGRKAA
jgi:DNA invertase Pin-like site-specific DNA recombinase